MENRNEDGTNAKTKSLRRRIQVVNVQADITFGFGGTALFYSFGKFCELIDLLGELIDLLGELMNLLEKDVD